MRLSPLLVLLLLSGRAGAQEIVRNDELLASDRTEAWAMDYVGAATLMTPFGDTSTLAPGEWNAAVDLGEIPRLSQERQRVGLHGVKQEDLNKSPVFGRLRMDIGLPAAFRLTLGWTPPVRINGLRTHDLYAVAFGRSLVRRDRFELSARVFGQHGSAEGDITCPARLADVTDPAVNPFGCTAPSDDRIQLRHYGADMTAAWTSSPWHWHASVGVARMEPEVDVDAVTGPVRDRSRLVTRDVVPYFAVGAAHDFSDRWRATIEYMYVPLSVRRDDATDARNEPFRSFRVQLRRSMN
jgi:hypothetical protein